MVSFPAPVGGVPSEEDFVPSIIFAVVFANVVFIGVYRLARASTRTRVILGPMVLCIERVVVWSLRAEQAKTPSEELDRNLIVYCQVTFSVAYISILACLVNIFRCVLVATTKGGEPTSYTTPLMYSDQDTIGPASYDVKSYTDNHALPTEDRPVARFLYRHSLSVLAFHMWIPVIMGTIMGYIYVSAENDVSKARKFGSLRYMTLGAISTHFAFFYLAIIFALVCVRGINRRAVLILFGLECILLILPAYELVVARDWTNSLTSTAPGSQNTPGEKTAFYMLRAAPEALICAIIMSLDVRNMFGTGIRGDDSNDAGDVVVVAGEWRKMFGQEPTETTSMTLESGPQ